MKKLLLVVLVSASVFSANAMYDNQVITLISLDKEKFQVEAGVAKQSVTLKNLMEDVDVTVPLDLPNIRGATLATILELLRVIKTELNPQEAQTYIQAKLSSLSEAALIEFIAAVNFLDIPQLLQSSIAVAEKTDLQKIPLEQFMALPKELRNSILLGQTERLLGPMQINQIAQLGRYANGMGTVYSVAVMPDGNTVISGSWDGTMRKWDLKTHQEIKNREVYNEAVDFVRILPDGTKVVTGSLDNAVRVWNADDFVLLAQFQKHPRATLTALCVAPDSSKVISGWTDGILCIWDIRSNQVVQLTGHTDTIESISVTPDGTKIIAGSHDGVLAIWNATNHDNIIMLNSQAGAVRFTAITPDGKRIISCHYDGMIRVWDLTTYKEVAAFRADAIIINALCLTPDGTMFITASADGTLRVWDFATFREIGVVKGQAILSVAVTPDGSKIISGSDISEYEKNAICVWDISLISSLRSSIMHMPVEKARAIFLYLKGGHVAGWAGIEQLLK